MEAMKMTQTTGKLVSITDDGKFIIDAGGELEKISPLDMYLRLLELKTPKMKPAENSQ